MEINCKFEPLSFASGYSVAYNCLVERLLEAPLSLNGVHKNHKSDQDVHSATFNHCKLLKFPNALLVSFEYLERLSLNNCGLTSLTRNDLKGLKKLQVLWLDNNEIASLPGDLFNDMSQLENVSFYKNKIEVVDLGLFEGIPKIKKFDLRFNKNFNLIFEADKGNSLKEFMLALQLSGRNSEDLQKGLIGDIKRFIHNPDFRDFTVTINDVEFDVHRFLLEARSSVLGETIRNNPDVFSLNLDSKISIDVFRVILDWLYEDKMPTKSVDLVGVYDAAKAWELTDLVENVREKLLKNHLNGDNAVKAFVSAHRHNDKELKRVAFEEVRRSYPDLAFLSEDLLLMKSNVEEIVLTEKKFDDEIHEDMKKIEELRKKVEQKQMAKAQWISGYLFGN